MPKNFEDLNDHLLFTKVDSRSEALKMKDSAIEANHLGKTVVIFYENKYHLYLAPGYDPYQIRKEIVSFMNQTDESTTEKTTTTATSKSSKPKLKT